MGDLALITLSASVSEEAKKKEEEEKETKKKEEEKDEKKQEEEKKEEEPAKEEKTEEAKKDEGMNKGAAAGIKEGPKEEKTKRQHHDVPLPRPPTPFKKPRMTTSNDSNNDNKNNSVPQQIQNIKNKLNELTEAFNLLQNTISPKEEMKQEAAEGTKEGPKEEKDGWQTVGRNGKVMKRW